MIKLIQNTFKNVANTSLVLAFLLGGLSSCKFQPSENTDYTPIPVNPDVEESKLSMSELFSDLKYIKLETNPQSLIGQVSKIIPFKEQLIIVDKMASKILIFGKDGQFIKSIGKKGSGPGEFTGIEDVAVDEKNNRIFVLDDSGQQLLIFNLQNEYCGKKNIDFITREIEFIGNSLLVCYCDYAANANSEKKDMRPNLFLLDINSMDETPLLYTPSDIAAQEVNSPFSSLSAYNDGCACLFDNLTNSVYTIDSDGITSSYKCNFGEKEETLKNDYIDKLRKQQLGAEQIIPGAYDAPTYVTVTSCISCTDYLLLTAINYSNGNIYQIVYSPDSKKCLYARANRTYPLENDIDGIVPFAPYASDNKNIYGVIESYQLTEGNENVSKLIGNINEDDNPIIVIAETKQQK